MEQITTTGVLALFETTKEQRQSFVNDIIERVREGQADPLQVQLQLKCAEEIIEKVTSNKDYKRELIDAADKHGKSFSFQNAKFQRKETGVKYDYSVCNDRQINELLQMQQEIEVKLKERQDFLKSLPEQGIEIRVDDELVTIYRPAKSSTTTIAVTLK